MITNVPNRLILHGGAGNISFDPSREQEISKVLKSIIKKTYSVLQEVGARKAVIYGVKLLEDYPIFNAGTGSKIQADGVSRMSAAIMDNSDNIFSAVVNVEDIQYPIELAELLASQKNKVLAGEKATEFAKANGFPFYNPITEERLAQFNKNQKGKTCTVGIVALDSKGIICAGTSTGGTGGEIPGRVSDSSTVAGNYVSQSAGITMTGIGEDIVNIAAAPRVTTMIDSGFTLEKAISELMKQAENQNRQFGLIAIDKSGNMQTAQSTKNLYFASYDGKVLRIFDEKKPLKR
jgi:L-asparaginase